MQILKKTVIIDEMRLGKDALVEAKKRDSSLVLESSLQGFFFDKLGQLNKKSIKPLPDETIYYSSIVMDKFGESDKYFEINEGRVREKILGQKLLETMKKSRSIQKRDLKDIGDTALVLCGFFSDSLNRKIVDCRYYQEVGIAAYKNLNAIVPQEFKVNSFYKILSNCFETLTNMIGIVSKETQCLQDEKTDAVILIINKKIKAS